MPRRTAKSRKNNQTVNSNTCHIPTTTNEAISTPTKNVAVRKARPIKQEKELDTATETVTEQVVHRKSERRRVARDIFLVFEEQPSSRRSGRTNKKQPTKPKFGHLKVEDPIKAKGLLRDIKNEPKCYLTGSGGSNTNTNSSIRAAPTVINNNNNKIQQKEMCVLSDPKKSEIKKKKSCTPKPPKPPVSLSANASNNNVDILNVNTVGIQVNNSKATSDTLPPLVARVNPIFLWVKQDDTRIVEVRCEDYDKRNRIRITKTSNGWRAIPRSDPTSSRVLKFYPTPLMKVKRENHVLQQQQHATNNIQIVENKQSATATATNNEFLSQNTLKDVLLHTVSGYELKGIDTVVCNPLATAKKPKKKKSSKRKKKSAHCRKTSKNSNATATKDLFETSDNPLSANNQLTAANYIHNANSTEEECQKNVNEQQECSNVAVECKIDKDVVNEKRVLSPSDFVKFSNEEVAMETNIKPLQIIPVPPAMSLSPINEVDASLEAATASESEHTYQKETQNEFSFQLCPKTGLFLPNNHFVPDDDLDADDDDEIIEIQRRINVSRATACSNHNQNHEHLAMDLDKVIEENKSQTIDDNTAESLEAKTKNLKDLLDDADLLQHCDDNDANSDAELIDTLVKTSCENNLIQANEIIAKGAHIDHIQQKSLHSSTNELVVQLITDVSDPPKCLSFNEAGEIEGLNGELFQANSYIESFEKQPSSALLTNTQMSSLQSMSVVTSASSALSVPQESTMCGENIPMLDIMDISNNSSKLAVLSVTEESPKDLSYKKREEVCPPSESRSQCAVTSSSDIIKSPQHDETSALASSSETLKNLILEQFIKLNALSTNKQIDPIDLGKKKQLDNSNTPMYSGHGTSSNFIETVVIDDDDDEEEFRSSDLEGEPLKKRIRLNTAQSLTTTANKVENVNVKAKMAMIDKDPDPLTQLRLLIQNTQWKVPDPILVPKDRLTAVLASPAREIPLLITTRPELRLPEAFAYPEIIQNPNILVISMAQLEAILQNEVELDKASRSMDIGPIADIAPPEQQTAAQHQRQHQSLPKQRTILNNSNNSIHEQNTDILTGETTSSTATRKDESAKCSHIDSSLASDINTATMAVLNQMLWLPYFGQISHDLIKSIKNPHALQQKCTANLMPFFNSQLNGLQNMEEVYKSNKILKQITHSNQNEPSAATNGLTNLRQQGCSTDELALFQKIVQHQMQSVLQSNQLKSPDASQRSAAATLTASNAPNPLQSSIETTSSHIESLSNFIEQKKQKKCVKNDHYKTTNPSLTSNTFTETGGGSSCNMNVAEKSYNLRSSAASRQASESKQYSSSSLSSSNNQRQNADNKPRLTCKSLSNLLDPEHSYQHSFGSSSTSSSIPFVTNEASDFLKGNNGVGGDHTIDCKNIGRGDGRGAVGGVSIEGKSIVPPPLSRSVCSISNSSMDTFNELSKQHKAKASFGDKASESSFGNSDASVLAGEANVPLWHPLFGSNSKSAYSSPWQWTTVTASGE